MATVFDLLSGDPGKDKQLFSLSNMSKRKKKASGSNLRSSAPGRKEFFKLDPSQLEFVAIDVETTGLDPKSDRIIEIGAVTFSGGNIVGEYSTLVNPETELPSAITQLTGITKSQIASAPPFEHIAQRVLQCIGRLALCGHQIDFDINFINEEFKRIGLPKLTSLEIDTALLSRILAPGIARYSLKHVARSLGIDLTNAHRALADAKASGQIACLLLSKLDSIPIHVRTAMAHFAPPSLLKSFLMKSIEERSVEKKIRVGPGVFQMPPKNLVQSDSLSGIMPDAVRCIFGMHGRLSELIKDFTERPSQTRMALCVAEAFNTGSFLVAEAGTGTGKSLAYLIPAALYALKNGIRVLISTNTRNLQDQLVAKDLPLVKRAVDGDLRFCVLKGRSNYLCLRRYNLLLSGNLVDLSYRERMGLLPLIEWVWKTKTGDIEEQSQFNIKWFSRIWRMISAEAHLCEGKRCPQFDRCFLQNARMRALGAHIVVINHSLFYSDVCSESSFLGRLGPIIFDEAHHLESCGHRHLRVEVDTNRFLQFLDSLMGFDKEIKKSAMTDNAKTVETDYKAIIKRTRSDMNGFLETVNTWAGQRQPSSFEYQIGYTEDTFSGFGHFDALMSDFSEIQDTLHFLIQSGECHDEEYRDEGNMRPQLRVLAEKTSQLKADLDYVARAVTEDHVFWIEGNRKKGWVKLCGVALDIGSILSSLWEKNQSACIFTSATLSIAHSMEYFKRKIGLVNEIETKTQCESFESPFKPDQALRFATRLSPDPDAQEYPAYTANVIAALMSAFQKNILVLFTSNTLLEAVYLLCKDLPFSSHCTLLAQGITGNRQTILEEFKNSTCCVLLGADSFWEGIDVPGKACEIVIITRLPFQMPTHPLTMALAQRIEKRNGESFFSYSVPEAVIKFRQGTGRLIRSLQDRGALIVLDNRILTKPYGKRFSESLGGEMRSFSSIEEIVEGIRSFFSGDCAQDPSSITYVPFEEIV